MMRLFFGGLFLFVLILPSNFADAASLYIDPAFTTLYRGDAIKMAVRLDTNEEESECVNAIDGVIAYSPNISPVDISLGSSIFNVWVEEPVINTENRTITFAGGIPNGYCGRVEGDPRLTNTVLEIIVRSPGFSVGGANQDTVGSLEFMPETTAYLNDGLGTRADLALYGAQLQLEKTAGSELKDPWRLEVSADNVAPEEFGITLERDEKAFGGKYYIVFSTTDKQTGIDHYEIIEEPLTEFANFAWGRADAPWIKGRSPFVLRDQSLNSTIRVRAVDKAGNEYVATLLPHDDLRTISTSQLIMIIGGFVTLLLFGGFILWLIFFLRKRKKLALLENDK